jgi:tetratricopeptide (TPR) repeat protein
VTQATGKRRGYGEDSIYWDESRSRYVGAVSLGFSASGARVRKKVTGRTKTEVRENPRELHHQVEGGLQPRRRYTVADALEDWLAYGVDGLSARTVTLYRGTIVKAVDEELGAVRLTELTARDVQGAGSDDYPAAAQALEQALGIYRDLGDRRGQGNVLGAQGDVRRLTGDYPAAVQTLEQALAIYRDLGERYGRAFALKTLGVSGE